MKLNIGIKYRNANNMWRYDFQALGKKQKAAGVAVLPRRRWKDLQQTAASLARFVSSCRPPSTPSTPFTPPIHYCNSNKVTI